jgi:uncharacterized membrane protein
MKPAKNQTVNMAVQHQQAYSGPIPDPDSLARYEQIQPGLTERIMNMAEKEAEHRRENDKLIVKSSIRMATIGILFAFFSVLLFGGIIVYAVYKESNVAALSTVVAALASLAGVFVFFRNKIKKS